MPDYYSNGRVGGPQPPVGTPEHVHYQQGAIDVATGRNRGYGLLSTEDTKSSSDSSLGWIPAVALGLVAVVVLSTLADSSKKPSNSPSNNTTSSAASAEAAKSDEAYDRAFKAATDSILPRSNITRALTVESTLPAAERNATVNATRLNLRSCADVSCSRIAEMKQGEPLKLLRYAGEEWWEVSYEAKSPSARGYARAKDDKGNILIKQGPK